MAFQVRIEPGPQGLCWIRTFGHRLPASSTFVPAGRWPDGHWEEVLGAVRLRLGVDIAEGGWRWRLQGARVAGFSVPRILLPILEAGKQVEGGHYRFSVVVRHRWIGELVTYEGLLASDV